MAIPRVVILGAGFAGMNAARGLNGENASVTVVDRSNHHLFQPLLYQVATASLSPADIAYPIRSTLRNQKNVEVLMAEVTAVNRAAQTVSLTDNAEGFEKHWTIPYDVLVVATGAQGTYFGHDDWAAFAPGLKSIPEATRLRQKILTAFEAAEMEENEHLRAAWMHFILVGGGPTGVEMAGAIGELAHRALIRDFRRISSRTARITLIEAGSRILAGFPEDLSRRAERDLKRLGVDVMAGTRVERIEADGVVVAGQKLEARTVVWTAGVTASPAAKWLGVPSDRSGRVVVTPELTLESDPSIFVVGDTALVLDDQKKPLPGLAPVAMQQGKYVAKTLRRRFAGKPSPGPFRYWDKGNLATIGRRSAIADVKGLHLTGFIAWLTWIVVHIFYLIGFRNRVVVLVNWAWSYLTFQRGARLITGKL